MKRSVAKTGRPAAVTNSASSPRWVAYQAPAELAGTALFLATDDASHMTGGYMVADGEYNMVGA